MSFSSSREKTLAAGFIGLLRSTALVRGEKAAASASRVERPVRRRHADEPRHAPCPLHQRQIAIVERLDQHDLVARLDQRVDRVGQRLGGAGRDQHLARRIDLQAVEAPPVRRHRLAQRP